MKAKKWLTIITLVVTLVAMIVALYAKYKKCDLAYDFSMAIFGSALLGFIMSLTEYFTERRKAMEDFLRASYKVYSKLRKIKYIDTDEPRDLIIDCIAEEQRNDLYCGLEGETAKAMGMIVDHTKRDEYIAWMEANEVFRNAKKENPAIQLLKQRLGETENALNNLLRAIEEGIITPTTKQRMIELEQTRDEIKLKLIKEEMKKPTVTKEGLVLWLKHIQSMSLETKEHKQRLIDIFVNAVYLYDDKLVITFNYKEASKTVTLKEVNGSIIECSGAATKRPLLSTGLMCPLSSRQTKKQKEYVK